MELDDADIRALARAAGGPGTGAVNPHGGREDGAARPPQGRNKRRGSRMGGPRGSGGAPRSAPPSAGASGQPDPMKTAFGYIGADSFSRQRQESGQRGRNSPNGQRRGGRNK